MVPSTMPSPSRGGKYSAALETYLSGGNAPKRFERARAALMERLPEPGDTIPIGDAIAIVDFRGPDAVIEIFRLIRSGNLRADLADRRSGDMSIVLRRLA